MDLDAIEKYLLHRHYASKILFLILWIVFKYIEVYFYLSHSFIFVFGPKWKAIRLTVV